MSGTGRIDAKAVARRLRALRALMGERGWTQAEAAERTGVSVSAIQRAEDGRFSIDSLVKMQRAYGSSLDYIIHGDTQANPPLRPFAEPLPEV